MKSFIALAFFVAAASAAALTTDPKDAVILKSSVDNIGIGAYNYESETSDGKYAQESGALKNVGAENEAIEVRGQFSYLAPDGVTYTVTYIANENGFQPSGAHLPVAP